MQLKRLQVNATVCQQLPQKETSNTAILEEGEVRTGKKKKQLGRTRCYAHQGTWYFTAFHKRKYSNLRKLSLTSDRHATKKGRKSRDECKQVQLHILTLTFLLFPEFSWPNQDVREAEGAFFLSVLPLEKNTKVKDPTLGKGGRDVCLQRRSLDKQLQANATKFSLSWLLCSPTWESRRLNQCRRKAWDPH